MDFRQLSQRSRWKIVIRILVPICTLIVTFQNGNHCLAIIHVQIMVNRNQHVGIQRNSQQQQPLKQPQQHPLQQPRQPSFQLLIQTRQERLILCSLQPAFSYLCFWPLKTRLYMHLNACCHISPFKPNASLTLGVKILLCSKVVRK